MVKSKKKNFRNKKYKSKRKIYKGGNPAIVAAARGALAKKQLNTSINEMRQSKDVSNAKQKTKSEKNISDAAKQAKNDIKDEKGILSKTGALAGTVTNLASGIFTRGLEHSKQVGLAYNDLLSPYLCDDCKECYKNTMVSTVKESNKNKIIDIPNKINLIQNNILDCYVFENENCTIKNKNNEKCKDCKNKIKMGKKKHKNRRIIKEDPDANTLNTYSTEEAEREKIQEEMEREKIQKEIQNEKEENKKVISPATGGNRKKRKLKRTKKKLKKKYYLEKYYKSKRN